MKKKINNTFGPSVSISCITFNHAPYIRQCLDGFLMQKTNFLFEVLIHDDASTDGTTEIIKEYAAKYPNIIKPMYEEENQWTKGRKGSLVFNFPRASGKYFAFCEGDDYWIDPNKLQMQVDFLENNPEYGMCYTKAKQYDQSKKYFIRPIGSKVASFNDLLRNGNRIPTLTVCIRKFLLLQYLNDIKPETKNWLLGDLPLWLWFYYNSKVYYSPDIVAVYRKLESSASHSKDFEKQKLFERSCYEVRNFYKAHYNLDLPLEWNENSIDFNIAFHQFDRKRILQCTFKTLEKKEKIVWLAAHSKILFYLIKKIYFIIKGSF